jgi:hypothetical protein
MRKTFGSNWKKNVKRLSAMIEVFFPYKRRLVRVPLVDVGPGENAPSGAEVDLTWACDQFLGTQGGATVEYRLLIPSGFKRKIPLHKYYKRKRSRRSR